MIQTDAANPIGCVARAFDRARLGGCLGIVIVALAGCSDSGGGEAGGPGAAAGGGGQPPAKVGVVTIEPQPVTLTASVAGRVVAFQVAQVRPQVGGLITERLFDEGAEVEKGQVLYKLDGRSYQALLDSAQATMQKNEAALETARLQYQRYQNLGKSNVVSQSDRDTAQSTFLQAKADVAVAQASLETAKLNLDYTSIKAPIAGRVGTDPANPGNLVTADQTDALATIRQIDPVYVDFTESSGNLLKFRDQIRQGGVRSLIGPENAGKAEVRVTFADGSSYPEIGTIDAADQFVSETTSSFTVRTKFQNPDNTLLPGMYVRGTIRVAVNEKGFLLPQRAVSRNTKGEATAMFLKDDSTAETRVLEVSSDIGDQWFVSAGVSKGDKLIVDGLQKVRDGAKVTPVAVTINDKGLVEPVEENSQGGKGGADGKPPESATETPAEASAETAGKQEDSATSAGSAAAAEATGAGKDSAAKDGGGMAASGGSNGGKE